MTQVTSAGAGGRPVSFSTAGLPEERRVELWESHNAEALIGLHCRTLRGGVLEATEVTVQLDRLRLARVQGSAHVVERDEALVGRRPTGSVAMFFALAGEAFFYHHDGVRVVPPGQLLVCDADRPFLRGFSQGLEELVLTVPHELFAARTGIGVDEPRVVDLTTDAVAHTLARHVGAAARGTDPAPADEVLLLDLVAALLGEQDRTDLAAAHRAVVAAYVERHLDDPGLSADRVASAAGISTRHLSRVLAASGTSLPRLVLERRLQRAHRMLAAPAAAGTTIAEVARRCGFTSPAHFSRAFVARFDATPGEVRRRAAAARPAHRPAD